MALDVWDGVTVVSKAVLYAATFAAAGGAVFLIYAAPLAQEQRRHIARGVYGCALASVAASVARVAVLSASMTGEMAGLWDRDMIHMVLGMGEGRALFMRFIGVALIGMMAGRAGMQTRADRSSGLGLGCGAVFAATSFAWVGHVHAGTMASSPAARVLAVSLLCIHLLCAAFWIGALPPLYLLSRQLGALELGRQAARFGGVALRVVSLLLAAGVGLVVLLLMPWSSATWSSGYLQTLLLKLVGVAALLAFAAYNRRRVTPQLQRGAPGAVASLRRSIAAEIALALLILCLTAALTTLTGPPRTADNAVTTDRSGPRG